MDFVVIFDKRNFKFSKPLAIIPAKPQEFKKKPIFQDLRNSAEFIFYWLKNNNNKNTNKWKISTNNIQDNSIVGKKVVHRMNLKEIKLILNCKYSSKPNMPWIIFNYIYVLIAENLCIFN